MVRQIVFLLFISSILSYGCKQKQEGNAGDNSNQSPPKIEFERLYYDFGTLNQGEKVSYTFRFKNAGGSNLLINDAIAACGCTVADFEKKPIKPGEKGTIEVVFDSRGRNGNQYKRVIVETNTPYGKKTLTIKANIINNKNQ